MSEEQERIELPKMLKERMLKFFLKAEMYRKSNDEDFDKIEQQTVNKNDRSCLNE